MKMISPIILLRGSGSEKRYRVLTNQNQHRIGRNSPKTKSHKKPDTSGQTELTPFELLCNKYQIRKSMVAPIVEERKTLTNDGSQPFSLIYLDSEVKDQVRKCVDSILDIYILYGFDVTNYHISQEYKRYFYLTSLFNGDFIKVFKLKLAALRAHYNQQVLPAIPIPDGVFGPKYLLGGKAYRFFNKLRNHDIEMFHSFIISLCRSKGAMPRPTKQHLTNAVVDTYIALTTAPTEVDSDTLTSRFRIDDNVCGVLSKENMILQIERTVDEMFKGKSFDIKNIVEPYLPSSSASYNNTKSNLGTVGEILACRKQFVSDKTDTLKQLIKGNVIGKSGNIPIIDNSNLYDSFSDLFEFAKSQAVVEESIARPVALAESLKTRVITKGPPYKYFVLKPLQKFLWKRMQDFKQFALTGTPVTEEFVNNMFGQKLNMPINDDKFLSVDYTDATNQIKSWASRACLERISKCLGLDESYSKIAMDSLTDHSIEVREFEGLFSKMDADFIRSKQLNGQLMGSIISFPILCIVNAAIVRWSIELDKGFKHRLRDSQFCVNGDDGLFKCSLLGKYFWGRIASFVGLKPSIGKVFYSSEFFEINSMNFRVLPSPDQFIITSKNKINPKGFLRFFKQTPYINSGILSGQQRSVATTKDTSEGMSLFNCIGQNAHQLLDEAPPVLRVKLYETFLYKNRNFLDRVSKYNIPFYVPTKFGGLGLPITDEHKPTDLDKRLIRKYISNLDKFIKPPSMLVNWELWNIANKKLKSFGLQQLATTFAIENNVKGHKVENTPNFHSVLSDTTLINQLVLETYLLSKDWKDFFTVSEKSAEQKLMRHLSKFWKNLLKDKIIPLPEPINLEKLDMDVYETSTLYLVSNKYLPNDVNFQVKSFGEIDIC